METFYFWNLDLTGIILLLVAELALISAMLVFLLKYLHLGRLIKVIDLISGVAAHAGAYDEEIVKISNLLPFGLIQSTEGNFAKRLHELIVCLKFKGIGQLINDINVNIKNKNKRIYLMNVVKTTVFKFSTEKLAMLLSELLICNAKNVEDNYKLLISDEKLKGLILKLVSQMTQGERRRFLKLCDEYCSESLLGVDDNGKLIVKAELVKINAPYSQEFIS
ncbi:MAG: hypothetical protein ACOYL8_04385 [Patescibacteria group bacterium]